MQHKNIAVLMTALDSETQVETLRGIEEYGKENNCNIAVFLWYTGAYERVRHNLAEINIIDLPDLNLFDGVIVFSNSLHVETNRNKVEELVKGLTCPVVCLGCKIEGCYHVGSDGYAAMRKLMEHLVVDHGIQKIHFVKGVEGNADGEERYRAYVDVLSEHGIPVVPERTSPGDFYVTGAELAAKEILNSTLPFPEAVVCANDIMAITICDIFTQRGIRVPEDVIITGYDYSMEGVYHSPTITTIRTRLRDLGKATVNIIIDVLEGKEVPQDTYLTDEVVYGESCGCQNETDMNLPQKSYVSGVEVYQRKLIYQMVGLEKNIMSGTGFKGWIDSVMDFVEKINPPEFYYCVNENFTETVFELDAIEQEDMSQEEKLAYTQNIKTVLAYQNGVFKNKPLFESRYAFDDLFHDTERSKMYIFSPLHYLERNFGYFVLVDSEFPMGNPLYISWLISMGDAIENLRQESLLKIAMKHLDDMYIKDSLTGVYNRFGMERFFAEIKKKCLMSRMLMQLSFVDLDNLKKINDEFGHEEGDRIISMAATILQKKAGKNYVVRYGGDEFVIMGTVRNEAEVETYWKDVQAEIQAYNQSGKQRAQLSMSYGYDIFEIKAETNLEECIRISDKKMYLDKNKKRG